MKKILKKSRPLLIVAALILTGIVAGAGFVHAQASECSDCGKEKAEKKTKAARKAAPRIVGNVNRNFNVSAVSWVESEPEEKAIAVSPKVFVTLCVRRGAVKVNGWDRQEVRVFRQGVGDLGIKVLERGDKDVPAWVEILGYDPEKPKKENDKCIVGEMIELDVPEGASVTIKGLSSETSIERVRSASVEIVGGDIYLNDIAERIDASTQQGGVTVNNSKGRVAVATTTGNIVAYNTEAIEPGDFFKAKTRSGAVTLQTIGQKEIAASTITGSINYLGEIKNYGRYDFTTNNGVLNLVLPETSSFWLTAAYGGRFISEFPVTVITENDTEEAFFLRGRVGTGEANLSVKSFSGTIQLKKRRIGDSDALPRLP